MGEKTKKAKEQQEPSVLVLLSSYNGEKYIREQLDSILGQKGCRAALIVRDDGSTDATGKILREYQCGAFREQFVAVREEENIGVVQSFFRLMRRAAEISPEYEYYALADQDDIWQKDKLLTAVRAIAEEERRAEKETQEGTGKKIQRGEKRVPIGRRPCLYAGAVQPVNEQGRKIPAGIRYPERRPAFGNALVENICPGCTCVMNRQLLQLFCSAGADCSGAPASCSVTPHSAVLHDFWLYLLASAFGSVIFDEKPHILYRQHGNNSVGIASTMLENYIRRVRNFRKNRGKLRSQAKEFERLYGERLAEWDGEKALLLRDFAAGKRRLIFDKRLYRQRRSDDWIMRCLLLLGGM